MKSTQELLQTQRNNVELNRKRTPMKVFIGGAIIATYACIFLSAVLVDIFVLK